MTGPSQTPEAAGLEVVGQAGSMPGTSGFTMAAFKAHEVPIGTDLVTAASAQAAIDAEKAKVAELERVLEKTASDFREAAEAYDAEKARADRLAKTLETLEAERKREGVNLAHLKRAVAVAYADTNRAALQQEAQP